MTAVAEKKRVSPDDLLMMPNSKGYELVNGELVERKMGYESSWVAMRLALLLGPYLEQQQLGWIAGSEAGFQCFPDDPGKVRKADISFIRRGRFQGERLPRGWVRLAPDLVVEVISPGDLAVEIDQKIQEYLGAGVQRVWIINPDTRTIRIHRPDGSATTLQQNDELSGEEVVPGFRCRVGELFPKA